MFGLASGIYQSYFAPPKLSILIIGLDGSGKTSLLDDKTAVSDAMKFQDNKREQIKWVKTTQNYFICPY